jgi:hypothetical protein
MPRDCYTNNKDDKGMLPNELFALECRKRYEEQGLIVDKNNGVFAHCPLPKGVGDKGLYLTWEDHQHQGLLQSKDVGRRCFWIADVKRWLDTYPPHYFELYDIYQEYISGVHCHLHGKVGELHPRHGQPGPMLGRTGELHPAWGSRSKPTIAIKPDGTKLHFVSVHEAARELGIKQSNLSFFIRDERSPKRGKFKGWQFFFAEPR